MGRNLYNKLALECKQICEDIDGATYLMYKSVLINKIDLMRYTLLRRHIIEQIEQSIIFKKICPSYTSAQIICTGIFNKQVPNFRELYECCIALHKTRLFKILTRTCIMECANIYSNQYKDQYSLKKVAILFQKIHDKKYYETKDVNESYCIKCNSLYEFEYLEKGHYIYKCVTCDQQDERPDINLILSLQHNQYYNETLVSINDGCRCSHSN